jgi:hypothetical protein
VVELRDLCREEVEGEWDVARRACAQCFELGKFEIARAEVGDNLNAVAGIGMAEKGLRKSFFQS